MSFSQKISEAARGDAGPLGKRLRLRGRCWQEGEFERCVSVGYNLLQFRY